MSKPAWSVKDIPQLNGKTAIVTGATGGLGYETALRLAEAGAKVIVAGRNDTKGNDAVEKIIVACPEATVSFGKVDLGSLASIKAFAENFNSRNEPLDILVNNAGVMAPPKRETTSDGFEIQFGTNHLGHFALTSLLLPSLRRSSSPRVVNVSSIAAKQGKIFFEDIQAEKSYRAWNYYSQSKLCNLLFTFELQRRSDEGKWGLKAIAAHPGVSRSDLMANGPGDYSLVGIMSSIFVKPFFSQSCEEGALPQLFAATSNEAEAGGYYGSQGFLEMSGPVGPAFVPGPAKDTEAAKKLWEMSVSLTGVQWP
jgi:NAD(P)-dependent dehydrogenase (short-subunit alcohol dehydrogenase family)